METRPLLVGKVVTVRPGRGEDVDKLLSIISEPSVIEWWAEPPPRSEIESSLFGATDEFQLVLEVDGEVAGGISYYEENEPMYRHAGIDIFISSRFQGRGVGTEAIELLARFLFESRNHRRLIIDPALHNTRAIRCYEKVGFRRVGVVREYERGIDGTFHDGLLMDLLAREFASKDRAT